MRAAVQYRRQYVIFGLGWVAYASTYFLRKPLGVIKADLESEFSFSKTQLGWLDTALFLPYALVQILLGPVGDKFGARKTLGVSLVLAALSMVTFGMWSNFYIFFFLLFLNGASQAQCWPSCGKALSAWFPDNVRNTVFGVFGTCAFVGGIFGTGIAVYLQSSLGWRGVYFPPSIFVAALGFVVLLLFKQPEEVGVEILGKEDVSSMPDSGGPKLSWLQLWKIPAVPEIAVSMFCLKIVRYCMYMWMPMYLLHQLQYTKAMAGVFSTMFEIGGVVGSASIGLAIDRYFHGRPLVGTAVAVFLSTAALLMFYLTSGWGVTVNTVFMVLAGVFNSGPDVILGGSMPAELGEMNGRKSAAAVVGLVNGFGSMGTFMEGPIIGFVTSAWGWSYMFHLLVALSLVGCLAVYKASLSYTSPHELPRVADPGDRDAVTVFTKK